MASPPPLGPGPVVLASDLSIFLTTIVQTTKRGPRSSPLRREYNLLKALRVCREEHRRGSSSNRRDVTVATVDLTPGEQKSDESIDTFLDACDKKLGLKGDRDGHVAVPCRWDDGDDRSFMANETDFIAVFAEATENTNQNEINHRCHSKLLKTLTKARQRGAVVIAVGQVVCRALGPNTHTNETNKKPIVPVVTRVQQKTTNNTPVVERDWRDLTGDLLRSSGGSPGNSSHCGLGLIPGGAALCFHDGSLAALVQDAVTFRVDTNTEKSEPAPRFQRNVLRAGTAVFGGGMHAATKAVCGDGAGEHAWVPSTPPPLPALTSDDDDDLSKRFASHEWWCTWSGLQSASTASTERAARLLARPEIKNVVFFTGAGISAESGMPAFRETVAGEVLVDDHCEIVGPKNSALDALTPLWKTYNPEQYSTLSAFRENPQLCWSLHRSILESLKTLKPNEAHRAIDKLANVDDTKNTLNEKNKSFNVTVVTQNIDSLHQNAMTKASSYETLELHGTTRMVACLSNCGWSTETDTFLTEWDLSKINTKESDGTKRRKITEQEYPLCGGCGSAPAKPNCVLFGEALPEQAVQDARHACANAHAVVVIGTSLSVYPAADLPKSARVHFPRAPLVRIDATAFSDVTLGADDAFITGKAAQVLPVLVQRILDLRERGGVEGVGVFEGGNAPRMFS